LPDTEPTTNQPANNSLRIAMTFSLVCAGLLLVVWLINSVGITPESSFGKTIGFITIGIFFAFALAALAGLGFSIASLVKIIRKPGFYGGGRWLTLIVFLINAVLTLLGVGMSAAIISVMMTARNS